MKIESFYKLNMCPNCRNKCNNEPKIIYGMINMKYQSETHTIKCEEFKRAD